MTVNENELLIRNIKKTVEQSNDSSLFDIIFEFICNDSVTSKNLETSFLNLFEKHLNNNKSS